MVDALFLSNCEDLAKEGLLRLEDYLSTHASENQTEPTNSTLFLWWLHGWTWRSKSAFPPLRSSPDLITWANCNPYNGWPWCSLFDRHFACWRLLFRKNDWVPQGHKMQQMQLHVASATKSQLSYDSERTRRTEITEPSYLSRSQSRGSRGWGNMGYHEQDEQSEESWRSQRTIKTKQNLDTKKIVA